MMIKKIFVKFSSFVLVAFLLLSACAFAGVNLSPPYEINNKGLISLYRISAGKVAYHKFESNDLMSVYNVETKDEVVAWQASPEKSKVDDEDMVMFDYSKKEEKKEEKKVVLRTIDQKLYDRPLSNAVKNAIKREIGNDAGKMPIQKKYLDTDEITKEANFGSGQDQEIEYDNSISDAVKRKDSSVKEVAKTINAFMAPVKSEQLENTQFILKAKEINLNTSQSKQVYAFEFVPDYERTERVDDSGSGKINFDYFLSGDMNTQTGVVQSPGMIPTRVELNLGVLGARGVSGEIEVPLINEEGIQLFLQKQGLSIEGNLILLAVDPSILDVEIDSHFAQRFYFDENFSLLSSNVDAVYVMFAGVSSGNILVRYLLSNKESAQKVIYVGDGEMYFEDPGFTKNNRETFIFTTRSLLGQKKKELVIDGADIAFFNTSIAAKKKALNAYEIKIPTLISGMRKYFEFKHLGQSIFLGTSHEKEIEMPGNDFIAKVLEMNQINSLKERCVVQVNLSKDLEEMKVSGKNRSGEMLVETSFIDKDGTFSHNSEMAEKAFIVGDMEGQFNVRLDYTDGSTEFLKTFCSEGGYLVEQI